MVLIRLLSSTAQLNPEELKESKSGRDFPGMCPPTFFFFVNQVCSMMKCPLSGPSSFVISFLSSGSEQLEMETFTSRIGDSPWNHKTPQSSDSSVDRYNFLKLCCIRTPPPPMMHQYPGLETGLFLFWWGESTPLHGCLPPSPVIKASLITARLYIRQRSTLYSKNGSFTGAR